MNREASITAYIAKAQPFARPILEKVREHVHSVVPDVEEAMKWSMPAYILNGKILLISAAFKGHAALNFWRGEELGGDCGNLEALGQFGRICSVEQLPPDEELDRLIGNAAELTRNAPRPRKAKHPPKPPPELNPEFAAALAQAPQARDVLDSFPPSARRDYLEWIAEARQEATRKKRIATAIQWLLDGKRRNWKYEKC